MCGSNSSLSSSRMRYERLAGAPPSSDRWCTKRTGVGGRSGMLAAALDAARPMLARGLAHTVLHISESDAAGGAARSAYRIHVGLRALGNRSRMLVGQPRSGDPDVRSIKRSPAWRAADRAAGGVA